MIRVLFEYAPVGVAATRTFGTGNAAAMLCLFAAVLFGFNAGLLRSLATIIGYLAAAPVAFAAAPYLAPPGHQDFRSLQHGIRSGTTARTAENFARLKDLTFKEFLDQVTPEDFKGDQ